MLESEVSDRLSVNPKSVRIPTDLDRPIALHQLKEPESGIQGCMGRAGNRHTPQEAVGGGSGAQDGGKRPVWCDGNVRCRWFGMNRFGGSPGGGV